MPNSYYELSSSEITAFKASAPTSSITLPTSLKYIDINHIKIIARLTNSNITPNPVDYQVETYHPLRVSARDAAAGTITVVQGEFTDYNNIEGTATGGARLFSSYDNFRIYRDTPTDNLVDFRSGGTLSDSDMDAAFQQSLFKSQEAVEDASALGSIASSVNNPVFTGTTTVDNLIIKGDLTYGGFVSAKSSADQALTTNTEAAVVLGTEVVDTMSNFASNTFTVPHTGYYAIDAGVTITGTATALDVLSLKLKIGGAEIPQATHSISGELFSKQTLKCTHLLSASATNTVTLHAKATFGSGTAKIASGDAYFNVYRVR